VLDVERSLLAAVSYPAMPDRFGAAKVAAALTAVGLEKLAPRLDEEGHWNRTLSLGEQQRVALARALGTHPAILVADEPTGNLDETTGREIIELLFAGHTQRGTTLVLVTHDAELAKRCARRLHIAAGEITHED